jgi:hypothetical protein
MISAITNPFLYSYFNETFKNGLQKIFSSCCSSMNKGNNQISFDQTDFSINNIQIENSNLQSRSSMTLNGNFISRKSQEPSSRLTIISSNKFSSSISSQI